MNDNILDLEAELSEPVAKACGLDGSVLGSWLHALSYVRNLAAHHPRLWNRSTPSNQLLPGTWQEIFGT